MQSLLLKLHPKQTLYSKAIVNKCNSIKHSITYRINMLVTDQATDWVLCFALHHINYTLCNETQVPVHEFPHSDTGLWGEDWTAAGLSQHSLLQIPVELLLCSLTAVLASAPVRMQIH